MVSTEHSTTAPQGFISIEDANAEAFDRLNDADPWVVDVRRPATCCRATETTWS